MNEYFVTPEGRVWNTGSGKEVTQHNSKKGYPTVNIYLDNKNKLRPVHRLVALKYVPNPDNKPQVNHMDGNKENNHHSNLEWMTNQENCDHAIRLGLRNTSHKGEVNGSAKLTEKEVLGIRLEYSLGAKIRQISRGFNTSYQNVWYIVKRKAWKHI